MLRVGCMPCIMTSKKELKQIFKHLPDVEEKLLNLEVNPARTFFPPNYIPDRFCSLTVTNKKGESVKVPTIQDVKKYVMWEQENQLFDEEPERCMSHYSICE